MLSSQLLQGKLGQNVFGAENFFFVYTSLRKEMLERDKKALIALALTFFLPPRLSFDESREKKLRGINKLRPRWPFQPRVKSAAANQITINNLGRYV